MAQNDRIIDYLTQHGSITHREAEDALGVCRLASRISELKARGVKITMIMEDGINRFGEKERHARYFLGVLNGRTKLDTL